MFYRSTQFGILVVALIASISLLTPNLLRVQAKIYEPAETILSSKLVLLNVVVTDKNGNSVKNLNRDAFSIFDENILQKIEYFTDKEEPANIGFLIDASGSMQTHTEKLKDISTKEPATKEINLKARTREGYLAK